MSRYALDSSALLALILSEPGAEVVRSALAEAALSTVNLAEIVSKLAERGMSRTQLDALLYKTPVEIVPFTAAQAIISGELRAATRSRGPSLGDRACLALARERGIAAMTADSAWVGATEIAVVLVR